MRFGYLAKMTFEFAEPTLHLIRSFTAIQSGTYLGNKNEAITIQSFYRNGLRWRFIDVSFIGSRVLGRGTVVIM